MSAAPSDAIRAEEGVLPFSFRAVPSMLAEWGGARRLGAILADHLVDAVHFGQRLGGTDHDGGQLGDIHGRPAAEAHHQVATRRPRCVDAGHQDGFRRVGNDGIEHRDVEAGLIQ